MTKRLLLASIALIMMAGSALAQMPPDKWWRRPEIINNLALTEEQQGKLDGIFLAAANDLIDRRGDVQKQSVALRGELDQPQLNRANIQKVAARLNESRGRLFERELSMLVDMRSVLTEQQWNGMRARLDQAAERPRQQRRESGAQGRRPMMRPRPQ